MPLKLRCVCGQSLLVSRDLVGKAVRCPKCDTKLRVPGPKSAVPHDGGKRVGVSPPVSHDAPTIHQPVHTEPRACGERVGVSPPVSGAAQAETAELTAELTDAEASAESVQGYTPPPRLVSATHMVAGGVAFVALLGAVPAVYDGYQHFRTPDSTGLATWAYLVLLALVVQIGYAMYLWQMPDWSSVWVVTIVMLVLAVGYAMVLAATYVSRPDGWFVAGLQLADKLPGGQATGWCFIMVCLTSLMSYLSGRLRARFPVA